MYEAIPCLQSSCVNPLCIVGDCFGPRNDGLFFILRQLPNAVSICVNSTQFVKFVLIPIREIRAYKIRV